LFSLVLAGLQQYVPKDGSLDGVPRSGIALAVPALITRAKSPPRAKDIDFKTLIPDHLSCL